MPALSGCLFQTALLQSGALVSVQHHALLDCTLFSVSYSFLICEKDQVQKAQLLCQMPHKQRVVKPGHVTSVFATKILMTEEPPTQTIIKGSKRAYICK